MKLRILRDRLTLAQAAIAATAVALGGGMQWQTLALAAALTAWAFVRPLPSEPSLRSQRWWTVAVFAGLLVTVARAALGQEFLDAGVDFLTLLVVQRLFNRQRAREHMQLLLLGTLLMIIAAVINTDLGYPVLLFGYLFVASMALIVNHLMAEGERLGGRVMGLLDRQASRHVGFLWRAAARTSMIGALGGLVVFFVFPRFGIGVFLRGSMADEIRSGFSSEVELGSFGRIKNDATVVMRIKPPPGAKPSQRATWHLRGSSFDRYAGGRWFHGEDAERVPLRTFGPWYVLAPGGELPIANDPSRIGRGWQPALLPVPGFAASTESLRMGVTLEDIGADVLFAASEPIALRPNPRGLLERQRVTVSAGADREFRVVKPPGPLQYEFLARTGTASPAELTAVGDPAISAEIAPYLAPGEGLSPDVRELAEALLRRSNARTRLDKVRTVMDHLATFSYTIDLQPSPRVVDGVDPVEGFLFDTKAGHCEYFASAMVLLLREAGVPSRIVNGYYGAHWNEMGGFYAVRQADAHSWVEVHFGSAGWVTFDPTPPNGRTAGDAAPLWPVASEILDAVRNAYLEYVIDYDLAKQTALLDRVGIRRPGPRTEIDEGAVLYGLAILVMVFLVRRRFHRGRRSGPEVRIYLSLLRLLGRRGHHRRADESAARFARRLQSEGVVEATAFLRFARKYEALRFAASFPSTELEALRALARDVRRRERP